MRIVIDMQGAQSENRYCSIGPYTIALAQAIVRQRGKHEIILALNGLFPDTIEPIRAAFHGLLPQGSIRVWYAPYPVRECEPGNLWRQEVAECTREAFLASLRPDVVHVTSPLEGWDDDAVASLGVFAPQLNTVVTLYKLNPLFSPDSNLKKPSAYEQYRIRKIAYMKRARGFLQLIDPPIQVSDRARVPFLENITSVSSCTSGAGMLSYIAVDSLNENGLNGYEAHINSTWSENARKAIILFESLLASLDEIPQVDCNLNALIQKIGAISKARASEQDIIATAWAIATNHSEIRQKKLYVDISDLIQKDLRTGIQRVTRSTIRALLDNPPEDYQVEAVYATLTSQGYLHSRKYTKQLTGSLGEELTDQLIDPQPGDIFLGLDFVAGIVHIQQPYLKWMHSHGVSVYFIVYDLLPIKLPHAFMPGAESGHHQWLQIITSFDGAICISRAVQSDLVAWLNEFGPERLRPFKTGWFHLGADVENSIPTKGMPDSSEDVLAQLVVCPTFLMVGTVEPRKGHSQTLAAFDLLWADGVDVNLVVVGKQGWMVEELVRKLRQHPERNHHLFWLEGISDEYLEKIYAVSTCLIAASEDEGFGLPLIEAAKHQLPILARDIPVFREVAVECAWYFSGKKPNSITEAIKEWLSQYEKNLHPQTIGLSSLTWRESAASLLGAIMYEPDGWVAKNPKGSN